MNKVFLKHLIWILKKKKNIFRGVGLSVAGRMGLLQVRLGGMGLPVVGAAMGMHELPANWAG